MEDAVLCKGASGAFQRAELSSNGMHTRAHCWNFKWTAAALLSFIAVDQLMVFDVTYVNKVYILIN